MHKSPGMRLYYLTVQCCKPGTPVHQQPEAVHIDVVCAPYKVVTTNIWYCVRSRSDAVYYLDLVQVYSYTNYTTPCIHQSVTIFNVNNDTEIKVKLISTCILCSLYKYVGRIIQSYYIHLFHLGIFLIIYSCQMLVFLYVYNYKT